MIGVGVCQEEGVELWQQIQRNSWSAYPRKKPPQRRFKVRIGEDPTVANLEQQCCVADVGNLHIVSKKQGARHDNRDAPPEEVISAIPRWLRSFCRESC